MSTPTFSSPATSSLSRAGWMSMNVVPPPATMPSSTAARVAFRASSMRYFLSFISTSVAAPISMTATPPASFARRSWSFSLSKSDVVLLICCLIWATRSSIAFLSPLPPMIVVSSFVETILCAWPRSSIVTLSSLRPSSSLMTLPPVSVAISWSMALRRSPKPGALTARHLNVPRSLLTTSVVRASPSTSSAMMASCLPDFTTCSRIGRMSLIAEILRSVMRSRGSSSDASILSVSVTRYGEM